MTLLTQYGEFPQTLCTLWHVSVAHGLWHMSVAHVRFIDVITVTVVFLDSNVSTLPQVSWYAGRNEVASYPGHLTPVFVACSTNKGEALAKLVTCSDLRGCWVDVWRSGKFPERPQ